MAMNSQNFVGPSGSGYVVYVNGQQVGGVTDLNTAQNAFNTASGSTPTTTAAPGVVQPNGSATTTQDMLAGLDAAAGGYWSGNRSDPAAVAAAYKAAGSGGTGTVSAATKLMDAIASGDTAKFNEAIREFNAQQSQQQSQFNTSAGQTDRAQYSQLATSLLGTAAQLRGPQDYYQYQKFASGGRDLFGSLYGDQPMPAFSSPSGVGSQNADHIYSPGVTQPGSPAASVTGLMQDLGFRSAPGTSPISGTAQAVGATGAPAGSYTTVNGPKTLQEMISELNVANPGGGYATMPPDQVASTYASTTKGAVTPGGGGSTAPPTAGGTYGAGTTSTGAPNVPQVPVPYQINPGVWDSMSPVQQKLVMSAAAAGNPAYDDQDFLRQLNAQRPTGQAPAATTTSFSQPQGAF